MIPLYDDNPTTIKPVVTIALIVACVSVFVYQLSLPSFGRTHIRVPVRGYSSRPVW